jgi:hypothetical protein
MMLSLRFAAALFVAFSLHAQPPVLTLSRATATPDGAAVLELSYVSAADSPVAALQWTIQYPADLVASMNIEDGPALAAAHKTAMCLGDAATAKCLAIAANTETIGDGVVARLTFSLLPGADDATVLVADTLGVSADGQPVIVRSENGRIATTPVLRRMAPVRVKPTPKR